MKRNSTYLTGEILKCGNLFVCLFLLIVLTGCSDPTEKYGDSLLYAVLTGDLNRTKELIDKGVDINYQNRSLKNSVLHACLSNETENIQILEFLLEKGANVNVQNFNGSTPLIFAVVNNHVASIKLLLEKGADVTIKDRYGSTVLDMLDKEKDSMIISLLKRK